MRAKIRPVTLYALVDERLRGDHAHGVIELHPTRETAERALRGVLRDEPTWEPFMRVAALPLIGVPAVGGSRN
jgi:hypothetical protein